MGNWIGRGSSDGALAEFSIVGGNWKKRIGWTEEKMRMEIL